MKSGEKIDEKLIKKVLSGQETPEERRRISETTVMKRFMKLQWDESCDEPIDVQVGERIWEHIKRRCHRKHRRLHIEKIAWIRYAACAAVLVFIGTFLYMHNFKNDKAEYENIYAREYCILTLPDHSKVWMHPESSLRYVKAFNRNRKVWLKGDATFEVAKQTQYPFRVYINEAFVEVKGTTFHVTDRHTNISKVTLFSGRIDFHALASGKTLAIKPNQRITYHSGGKINIEKINGFKWQNGHYKFKDIRLDSLVNIVNGLYDTNIELSVNVPFKDQFTGMIRYNERPFEIAEKICYNMNLKYRKEKNKLIIYKSKKKNN